MADTTYTYTGNPFTTADAPFTTSDSISGFFTTSSPIAPNTGNFSSGPFGPSVTGVPILDLTSFSFSDGVDTITNTSPDVASPILNFATDGSGNIIAWELDISLFSGTDMNSRYENPAGFGFNGNDGALDAISDSASNSHPGIWALTAGGPSIVPEPSSLILLSTGVLGLFGAGRRRLTRV
ncbi:MAG TPA: PEP-CTERM sorting domain-containing protein [Acidobacteriaceae bacterium]|nr:PEP-CTERM sorting domain-containing protein [Acidobacteriaceae bacterium]